MASPTDREDSAGKVEITLTDPQVIAAIRLAAGPLSVDVWATYHFRSYFNVED